VANHKSSVKRAKQEKTRRMTNKTKTAKSRTAVKALRAAVTKGDLATAQSLLAKLAKSPAMKKQTAARKTSRLTKLVAGMNK